MPDQDALHAPAGRIPLRGGAGRPAAPGEPGGSEASEVPSAAAIRASVHRRWPRRLAVGALVLGGLAVLYYAVTFWQVWQTGRTDEARPADAIVVLGAAQYDGRPSPQLRARLDHALALWQDGVAPRIVVTGGKQPLDRFTEATASANYLIERGVPDAAILREVQGRDSYESIAATARILRNRGLDSVVLVSDPYHMHRIKGIAAEVGLDPAASATPTSPVQGWNEVRRTAQEAAGVALARFIGYRRLAQVAG